MKVTALNEILSLFDTKLLSVFGNMGQDANDIDILIVSDEFDGISKLKRRELIQRIDKRIDPLCLTIKQFQDFKKSNCSLFYRIKSNHETIYGDETAFF